MIRSQHIQTNGRHVAMATFRLMLVAAAIIWLILSYILGYIHLERYSFFAFPMVVGVLLFLWLWWNSHRKHVGDIKELEWLDVLVDEHKRGVKDNSKQLAWLISTIEKKSALPSDTIQAHLDRARRTINEKP